ncbi:hypothetical protein E0H39_29520 [Rhizobium leguminosarum bv. viciae]|uniref:hypothetical protein n=1 Tax=Rhizobium leguminosarum TaxID=384 RepID=UPI001038E962|nr:hypothetical protein [Rhizobium leguminosarum]TBY57959.1 hypothetical protein E0H39_29520 [Rhizobium leguminosarum bv. viciae]
MPEQLALQIDVAECAPEATQEVDLVESVIQACGGDPRAAVRELLADADFLRDQLYTASCLLSRGIGRGWAPKYERLP